MLGLDIGSNSVGSHWADSGNDTMVSAVSIFPAGVDESEEKRGDPKNVKRRGSRSSRLTLSRRSTRKRQLRLRLIGIGLLPSDPDAYKSLLDDSDPLELRRRGLDGPLSPHEFGRVLLHLAQRRGALGLKLAVEDAEGQSSDEQEDGKVKAAISALQASMKQRNARTVGEYLAMVQQVGITPITTPDRRKKKKGPREYRAAVRNKSGSYTHCADRAMIRDEFARLWDNQRQYGGPLAAILSDELRKELDDETGDSIWRHKGLLFGQRRTYWDTGTLGRCALHPEERCLPQADRYASQYLVVETINNLRIIEQGREARPLTPDERRKIKDYLCGPLGINKTGKQKGQPKRTVNVTDLRNLMGTSAEGWGRATKTARFHFNIESDEEREINTDWFNREIVHGAITSEKWNQLSEQAHQGINRAILKFDPENEQHAANLQANLMQWAGLNQAQADALVAAWQRRPKLDSKRLKMGRRAVRNLLLLMDRDERWPDPARPGAYRWLTQIEARKLIAEDADFRDVTTGQPLDEHTRRRYATGTKGATARDRHYMKKHLLMKDGQPVFGPDGQPLHEPPPAPLISNPVVRKTIHEVRRHVIAYMKHFARKPDQVCIELSRQAKMGKKDADVQLFRNRLRNRIRKDIIGEFNRDTQTSTQQRAAVDRVVLAVQQGCVCPLCGGVSIANVHGVREEINLDNAVKGAGCEIAHIIPRAAGGHNGLSNVVLAHTKCNRDMQRMTPRQFWEHSKGHGGYDVGIAWVEKIYGQVERPKPKEMKTAIGNSLWACYFNRQDDNAKVARFKMDVKDIQGMTQRQDAATKYAARQVMSYLADALYDGTGLPERGGERKIFATDGLWTSRLRREWGLFFDPHHFKATGLTAQEEHLRKEKDRGDHRHHAIDAVIIAHTTPQMRNAWDAREQRADAEGINTTDEEAMDNYRRRHPLPPPAPFISREDFRQAVRRSVYGDGAVDKPVCHRPVKRKLVGALHKATQYGPVVDTWKQGGKVCTELVKDRVTIRQSVLGETKTDFLKPAHLRMPQDESDDEAVQRLASRFRIGKRAMSSKDALKVARAFIKTSAFTRKSIDPKPDKCGIVRDIGIRKIIRQELGERGLNPDSYTKSQLKKSLVDHGPLRQKSGVPIHNVTLLWSNSDPVTIQRSTHDYATGAHRKLTEPTSLRLYDSQNNHHIEIRAAKSKKGAETWSGSIITTFEAAGRKVARLRAMRAAGIPRPRDFRKLPKTERDKFSPILSAIDKQHPLVNRADTDDVAFVMSLCEGEMLYMLHKETREPGYFVVAKLDKSQGIVLVPHWDARAAGKRKDADGNEIPNSQRDQFAATPNDLRTLAPPEHPHAVKVRISPLGQVTIMDHD
jgi:CRISPR-associated endonuclease Csn1